MIRRIIIDSFGFQVFPLRLVELNDKSEVGVSSNNTTALGSKVYDRRDGKRDNLLFDSLHGSKARKRSRTVTPPRFVAKSVVEHLAAPMEDRRGVDGDEDDAACIKEKGCGLCSTRFKYQAEEAEAAATVRLGDTETREESCSEARRCAARRG